MNKDYITCLYKSGLFTETDIHFAKFITDLSESNDPDIFLGAALVSSATGNGNICLDLALVKKNLVMHKQDEELSVKLPELGGWLKKLKKSTVVGKPGDYCPLILDDCKRLYLYRYWEYEKILSDLIKSRIQEDVSNIDLSLLKDSIKRLFPESALKNLKDEINWQKIATITAVLKKFCVVSGGPGTGKTYVVVKIIAILLEQAKGKNLRIFLCAPTGKAAAKLGETITKEKENLNCNEKIKQKIPAETYTIHRMLRTISGSPYFRYNSENMLPADVVVVDEASMVDLALMSKLISAIPMTARLILIGDRDQLSSVEAGSVLGDICDRSGIYSFSQEYCRNIEKITGVNIGASIKELKKRQGLYDSIVVLQKSRRFSESSEIWKLSQAVNDGDWEEVLSLLKNAGGEQIKWEEFKAPKDNYSIIAKKIIDGYSDYLKENDPSTALELFNRFKLLCALRIGKYGAHSLNRLAEEVLIREKLIRPDISDDYPWYRGRPVMIKSNDYSLGLFNGDTGITLPDTESDNNKLYVFFPGTSGEVRRFSPYRLPEHETVFAMTIHKSQGSEFDNVCLVFPDKDYPVLTRELVYTGITRAMKSLLIWGNENVIRTSISRKIVRTSGLRDALWEERA